MFESFNNIAQARPSFFQYIDTCTTQREFIRHSVQKLRPISRTSQRKISRQGVHCGWWQLTSTKNSSVQPDCHLRKWIHARRQVNFVLSERVQIVLRKLASGQDELQRTSLSWHVCGRRRLRSCRSADVADRRLWCDVVVIHDASLSTRMQLEFALTART